MSDEYREIDCPEHGPAAAAYVCRHLVGGQGLGFNVGPDFVGSVSTRSGTWMWSWANTSLLAAAKSEIRKVREYGETRSLLKLACAYWNAEEEDGWQMTAVSAYLLKAKGAYRSPDERGFTFMILTDVRWAQ